MTEPDPCLATFFAALLVAYGTDRAQERARIEPSDQRASPWWAWVTLVGWLCINTTSAAQAIAMVVAGWVGLQVVALVAALVVLRWRTPGERPIDRASAQIRAMDWIEEHYRPGVWAALTFGTILLAAARKAPMPGDPS